MGFRRRRWRDARPEEDKIKVNRAIRQRDVRVVNEDGQQLGVMSTETARDIAGRIGLDLVEISPNSSPPVCKIMDYGRYKYEIKKKASSAKKSQHQSQLKEVKLRPHISDHDLDFKLKNARKFLLEGDKVKCTVMFRGREIVYTQVGRALLDRVVVELEDVANAEARPRMEGRALSLTLAPNRAAMEQRRVRSRQEAEEREAAAARGEPPDGEPPEAVEAQGEVTDVEGRAAAAAQGAVPVAVSVAADPKESESAQDQDA